MKFIKKLGLGLLGAVGFISTSANAAVAASSGVTFDPVSHTFAGVFDLGPYYSAIGIGIGAVAIVASLRLAWNTFKRI